MDIQFPLIHIHNWCTCMHVKNKIHQLTLAISTSTSRVIHKEFHHLYAVALQQKPGAVAAH